MDDIPTLPLEEQADAWGALDEKIMTEYFPIIPTAFRNDLFVFGDEDRQPDGRRLASVPRTTRTSTSCSDPDALAD